MRQEGREEARGDVWRVCVVTSREQRLRIEGSVEAAGVGVCGAKSVPCGAKSVYRPLVSICTQIDSLYTTRYSAYHHCLDILGLLSCQPLGSIADAHHLSISIVSLHLHCLSLFTTHTDQATAAREGRERRGGGDTEIRERGDEHLDSSLDIL